MFRGHFEAHDRPEGAAQHPVEFREVLREAGSDRLVMAPNSTALDVYPEDKWRDLEERVAKLPKIVPDRRRFQHVYLWRDSTWCSIRTGASRCCRTIASAAAFEERGDHRDDGLLRGVGRGSLDDLPARAGGPARRPAHASRRQGRMNHERHERERMERDRLGARTDAARASGERGSGRARRSRRRALAGRGAAEGEPSAFKRAASGVSPSEPVSSHVPVLADEIAFLLHPRRGGWVVDGTSASAATRSAPRGRGGDTRLLGIDRDPEALARAARRLARFGARRGAPARQLPPFGALATGAVERAAAVLLISGSRPTSSTSRAAGSRSRARSRSTCASIPPRA